MSTGTTIQTAARYRNRLLDLANKLQNDTAEYRLACWAFANEGEILEAAKQIHSTVGRMIQRLSDVTQYLDQNTPGCLNPCGILQGLEQDLDSAVIRINHLIKQRGFYEYLLK